MKKTKWNADRLQRLFDRYNRMYFRRRLLHYRITAGRLDGQVLGQCDWSKRAITIDLEKHTSDRELRGSVLHEMAHAAAERGIHGHGIHFFAQVEKLLRQGAPITVDTAEGGVVRVQANLVPKRFPLLKRRMDRIEARRAKRINDMLKATNWPTYDVTEEQILARFGSVDGGASVPWLTAVRCVGMEFALTDETGRPLTPFARRIIAKARKIHRAARRDYLEDQRLSAMTDEELTAHIVKLTRAATA